MAKLINLSNHASSKWEEAQKKDWDKIVDIAFPNVSPTADEEDIKALVDEYFSKVKQEIDNDTYLYIAGEYTFCYGFIKKLLEEKTNIKGVVIPTTDRVVIEKQKEDGTIEKVSQFKFVKWRKAL